MENDVSESAKDEEKRQRFFAEMGHCFNAWSIIESQLEMCFQRVTKMESAVSGKVFHSAMGFDAKTRMILAAMEDADIEIERKDYFKKLISKAKEYSSTRNKIAHGTVLFIPVSDSKYSGQYIIVQGRDGVKEHPPESEVITVVNLHSAWSNFGALISCFFPGFRWDGKTPEKSPLKYLELVQQLPNPAHARELEPSIRAKLPI